MAHKILVTLGPSSINEDVVKGCADEDVYLFRLNLSHTPLDGLARTIDAIRSWTDVPVCLDSEGAQLRNGDMLGDAVFLTEGSEIRIEFEPVMGDEKKISFRPMDIARQFRSGDEIRVDFDHARLLVTSVAEDHCVAAVLHGGVGAPTRPPI